MPEPLDSLITDLITPAPQHGNRRQPDVTLATPRAATEPPDQHHQTPGTASPTRRHRHRPGRGLKRAAARDPRTGPRRPRRLQPEIRRGTRIAPRDRLGQLRRHPHPPDTRTSVNVRAIRARQIWDGTDTHIRLRTSCDDSPPGDARSGPVICGKQGRGGGGGDSARTPTRIPRRDRPHGRRQVPRPGPLTPNTRRAYTAAVAKPPTTSWAHTRHRSAELRPPAGRVADDEIGEALEALWGEAAVNTWNARRAAVQSWLTGAARTGVDRTVVPGVGQRSTPPDSITPVRSRTAIDRLIARRDIHLREKTLWRMLYETCARADELLSVNIEDLDLAGRCCPVKSKGAKPRTRRRGATHDEHVLETVYWDAGTARLLPD